MEWLSSTLVGLSADDFKVTGKRENSDYFDYDPSVPRDFRNDTIFSGTFPTGDGEQSMFYLLFESRMNITRD